MKKRNRNGRYQKYKEQILKYCKEHRQEIREYQHQWYLENKAKHCEQGKKWAIDNRERYLDNKKRRYQKNKHKWNDYYQKNKDFILQMRVLYRKEHKEEIRERHRNYESRRIKTDIRYRLNKVISRAIALSLKGSKNGRKWESLVGYDVESLKKYLTKTMPKDYTWQNYFEGLLHIDHKIPISVFNFTKPEHIDFKRCWALTNLQLLPAKENRQKSDKLTKPFQPSLAL